MTNMLPNWLIELNCEVVACTRCPRLVAYREQIAREKRRAYRDHEYWKAVLGLETQMRGSSLRPRAGAHGSNRNGGIHGDASNFHVSVLYGNRIREPAERHPSR
jgi:hypothetical protein